MAKIHKLKKDGQTIYPATIPQAVIDPDSNKTVKDLLLEKEVHANKQNSLEEDGTGTKYPTVDAVNDKFDLLESTLSPLLFSYGIEWDEDVANSACTRIGRMDLHKTLPIQNKMRRCLLLNDGTVNYYLDANDSTKKEDGSDAILDGTDGQVMVEIPLHYRKFEQEGTIHRVLISEYKLKGFHEVPKAYRSAYEATVERSTNKLSSVMNMDADYRGGNNNAEWDGTYRTLLGRPATAITGTNFAAYARNRGTRWCMDVYHVKKTMDWLYYIEYANFNSQLPFDETLTSEGFKQGGLGNGVTDLNSSKWSDFNGYYPFVPLGYTNTLGNKTGVKAFGMPEEYDENIFTTYVPSYRGVENFFGHIWKWADGLKIKIQADDAGGESQLYVTEDITKFQHDNYDGYDMRGLLPRADGYVSAMLMGEYGELMPRVAVGSSTTYFADYFYTSIPASGESQRGVGFGGHSTNGASAGLAYAATHSTLATATANIGSRLCFIPEN